MSFGGGVKTPKPPKPPKAPPLPKDFFQSRRVAQYGAMERRNTFGGQGTTILTSPLGPAGSPSVARNALIGK